jgi:predicted nucleic acid-binding protein
VLLWDASALAKRYAPEIGSASVDALFAAVAAAQMAVTFLGYAETYSILLRKHNRGDISTTTFAAAKSKLRTDIINDLDFVLLAVDEAATLDGIDRMERHNINSSDAAILATYKTYDSNPLVAATACVLVSSDQRLLREIVAAADIPTFLATL